MKKLIIIVSLYIAFSVCTGYQGGINQIEADTLKWRCWIDPGSTARRYFHAERDTATGGISVVFLENKKIGGKMQHIIFDSTFKDWLSFVNYIEVWFGF